ncbi:SCO family protein [Ferruginibacter albus]|uniref:SCO family protein n=1 Tax=Ferruginibacter albus TaxID=2875540 RepID=UPI001CC37FDD|nr:SCO family protein [Ferruginibacter albus]UAY51950.1 SCO family protein [Ferruginibacter albus]
MKKWLIYFGFFALLLTGFYLFLYKDFSQSDLKVINDHLQNFSFIDQNGKTITEKNVEGKVYVAEYFFTTCKAICPKMNANMRRVYDVYKDDKRFMILSHTCMPETDSVEQLKKYEYKMLTGTLVKNDDGEYQVKADESTAGNKLPPDLSTNWLFLTGDKAMLYDLAKHSYLIDKSERDTTQNISEQFIHTQLFALVDKQRHVRGIYDGLKEDEIQKLLKDIKGLLNEKAPNANLANGFSNTPN